MKTIKEIEHKQMKEDDEIIGKTIKAISEESRGLFLVFNDNTFCSICHDYDGSICIDDRDFDVDPKTGHIPTLLRLGFIRVEDIEERIEEQRKRERDSEIEELFELIKKYPECAAKMLV